MTTPHWLDDAIFYQIFPDRFALDLENSALAHSFVPNRDNFYGGTLRGIIRKLPYLEKLGINAIYLTPIFQADTNHRYDATDYFKVDPRLGTIEDFREFITKAHDKNIRVILDGVFNHCGFGHPYFQDIIKNGADSEYINWFSVERIPVETDPYPNYLTCSGCWYLPKWNIYNPLVREHHLSVARYWLEQGVDGWRLDVPYFINKNFWREFSALVRSFGKEKYLVAEEWRSPEEWLAPDLMHGTMNYSMRDMVLAFIADGSIDGHTFAKEMNAFYEDIPAEYRSSMLNLLGSHDTERLMSRCGDPKKFILTMATMFSCLGAPMIYYGDEVGMKGGNDPECRGAMLFDLENQQDQTLKAIQELCRMRSVSQTLQCGSQHIEAIDSDTIIIFRDSKKERNAAIVHRGKGTWLDKKFLPLKNIKALYGVPSILGTEYRLDGKSVLIIAGESKEK